MLQAALAGMCKLQFKEMCCCVRGGDAGSDGVTRDC